MAVETYGSDASPVREAQDNLRFIRDLMERSTRHSTFSGLSGVFAGLISIAGCLVQAFLVPRLPESDQPVGFLLNWGLVVISAIGVDFILTKRRAARVGKRILSRLGQQMLTASMPGLGMGALITLYFLQKGMLDEVYPFWMLCYGTAVCAVGLFSQRAVGVLGRAFLAAGAATLLVQSFSSAAPSSLGIIMMAISAGLFHIIYGAAVSRRDGW